jgi:trk system potassium uptake protein TrkA
MKILIVGCGRVGARTAAELDKLGENVTVIDVEQRAFLRLPSNFGGVTVRGSGTDEDVLREAGAELADLFMALTEGDNRNALAAQIGKHVFGVPRVLAKINDPVRAEAYRSLGLETICRTVLLSDALIEAASHGAEATGGAVAAPTAEPLRGAPAPGSPAAAIARAAIDEDGALHPIAPVPDDSGEEG